MCALFIALFVLQVMASVVTVRECGDKQLVVCCQPSVRSWAVCFGV